MYTRNGHLTREGREQNQTWNDTLSKTSWFCWCFTQSEVNQFIVILMEQAISRHATFGNQMNTKGLILGCYRLCFRLSCSCFIGAQGR